MKRFLSLSLCLALLASSSTVDAQTTVQDLRRAVPDSVYLAVYGRHNPERDFQQKYYEEVLQTVKDTKIIERALKIVTTRMSEDELAQAQAIFDELKQAVEPFPGDDVLGAKEMCYAQTWEGYTAQHLLIFRLPPQSAEQAQTAITNLFKMAEKYSEGEVPVMTEEDGGVITTSLQLPGEVPYQPSVIRVSDVLIFTTSPQLGEQATAMVLGKGGASKFDDPRYKNALKHLPEPEDEVVFYDGKLQFENMRGIIDFIGQQTGGDPEAERWLGLGRMVLDELTVLDYEVTVGYTEDNRNRTAAYGKLLDSADQSVLSKVFGSGEPFTEWHRWVPADAVSYSLTTGINLHPLYEWVMKVVKERIPEANEALAQFDQIQQQYDLYLDRDILQAFSGEMVSVSFPNANGQGSVTALRCHKPDRIADLMQRGIDALGEIPAVQAQQLKLVDLEDDELQGFQKLSAAFFGMMGVQPVIGFRDGWMLIGSDPASVKKVLATRAGNNDSIRGTDSFTQFGLPVDGPVTKIAYTDLAQSTRQMSQMLNQVGMMAPMFLGMAGGQANPEDLKPIQEALALLPSIAEIIGKFDFLQAQLSVTQEGEEPNTYITRSVILVRPEGS